MNKIPTWCNNSSVYFAYRLALHVSGVIHPSVAPRMYRQLWYNSRLGVLTMCRTCQDRITIAVVCRSVTVYRTCSTQQRFDILTTAIVIRSWQVRHIVNTPSLLLFHTCLYIIGAPDDGWMWCPKHVEQDDKWNKHLNCYIFETNFWIFSWLVKYPGAKVRTQWILAFFDLWDEPNSICWVTAGRNIALDLPPRLLVLDHCDWSAVRWCVSSPACNFSQRQIAGKLTKMYDTLVLITLSKQHS